jgi:flagellar biosynthesis/type III secretory pathway chaperone
MADQNAVIQAFERLEAAYQEMEGLVGEEHNHLLAPDWQALLSDQQRRDRLTAEVKEADLRRQELGKAAGLGPEAAWGDLLPGGRETWQTRREALRDCIKRVQTANETNVRLMREAFDRNERLIHFLTGAAGEVAYDANGEERSKDGSGLLSQRA